MQLSGRRVRGLPSSALISPPLSRVTDDLSNVSLLEKVLEIGGRIVVGSDGSIEELEVTSAEARRNDPMRRTWNRNVHSPSLLIGQD